MCIRDSFYRKGETARAVVARVDNKNNNPKIILSRTSPVFLQRLFDMEVAEINDGLITIKKIARIPGERAKIAVESYDDRIDPVGEMCIRDRYCVLQGPVSRRSKGLCGINIMRKKAVSALR